MTLPPAGLGDLEVILHHRREMGGDYERKLSDFEEASRRHMANALGDGSYYGLIGQMDGKPMAGGGVVIAAWPGSPLNYDSRRAWILNIYVDPECRHRGFARAITKALVEWCRENGFQSVALHASEFGRSLYENLGFRSTNEMRLRL
jgi:GNAT superfamily N-acetyltransferase